MSLNLKKARPEDVDLLFEWANDRVVRENSFNTAPIAYEEHVEWFGKILADESVHQYILYEDDLPVGQIRLNVENKTAVIDYSICAKKRGKGCGSELLSLVRDQLEVDKITNVTKLIGQVKYENAASSRAFERCGFTKKEMPEFVQYEFEITDALERGLK